MGCSSGEGCDREVHAKGMCRLHYTQSWRRKKGNTYTVQQRGYNKSRYAKIRSGLSARQLATARKKQAAASRAWRAKNQESLKNHESYGQRYLRRYGLTKNDYEQQLEFQGGCCAICKKAPKGKRLAVDHRHATRAPRGLLCEACNHGLGKFDDDPSRLR